MIECNCPFSVAVFSLRALPLIFTFLRCYWVRCTQSSVSILTPFGWCCFFSPGAQHLLLPYHYTKFYIPLHPEYFGACPVVLFFAVFLSPCAWPCQVYWKSFNVTKWYLPEWSVKQDSEISYKKIHRPTKVKRLGAIAVCRSSSLI